MPGELGKNRRVTAEKGHSTVCKEMKAPRDVLGTGV